MNIKMIQQSCLALVLGLVLVTPSLSRAGGNQGQSIAQFTPIKSDKELNDLKEGDTIVKVCRACGGVTLIRVDKSGKGVYDYVAKKCDTCGSDDTYIAVSKQFIPFKEQNKR
ncbi:MAG TPA: hypothetical protein VH597_17890 [Verrucomicrobiae bacterium]|jgi:hypothetical protein|nr:hypothetical protein [Verrucomicrobiae bacterium]